MTIKNGDLVTVCLRHWDKKEAYFICVVREYLDHREVNRHQFLSIKRVCKARHKFSKDIIMDSNWVLEPQEVHQVEHYKCDNSGIKCGKCDLCSYQYEY